MKKIIITIIMAVVVICANAAVAKPYKVDSMPANAEEFVKLRDQIAKTPEGGAVIFILAMLKYSDDVKIGEQFLTIALSQEHVTSGNVYKGFQPSSSLNYHLNRFKSNLFWPKGYIKGTTPDNGYAFNYPITFEINRNRYSGEEKSGKVKVFVDTYGVMARPMTMTVNDKGIWKASEFSSFFLPVQAPAQKQSDDL